MHSQLHTNIAEYKKIPTMPSGNRHKPWPSRKVTKVDEMVDYMPTFPTNVHPIEKGDDAQGKVLNVGILDWGSLEKWAYLEKYVANRRHADSPSRSNSSSSPYSTSISSSRSDRSTDVPLSQRKQSPPLVAYQNPDTGTSHIKASVRHNHDQEKIEYSDTNEISHDTSQLPDIGNLSCTPKYNDTSAFWHKNIKTELSQSREQGFPGNMHLAESCLPDQPSSVESMRGCLDENDCDSSIGDDSSTNRMPKKVNHDSTRGIFPPNELNFTLPFPQTSYSCPLPVSENEALIARGKEKHSKTDGVYHGLSEKFVGHAEVQVAARLRRELSPHRLLRAGVSRIMSSSSAGQQIKQIICSDNSRDDSATSKGKSRRSPSPQRLLSAGLSLLRNSSTREGLSETICSDKSLEDIAASNIRGRRSPLRRIFDPLKPKGQVDFSGPITSLPGPRAQEANARDKPPTLDEVATSTRQARVKLGWKNGLPLFLFSSGDGNILAATIGKGAISQGNECTYTIFTDHDKLKKKGGVWMSQIKKNKDNDLAYNNVVGQIRVSSSKLTKEFVLFGAEQISTSEDHFSPVFRNELAAIVIQDQNKSLDIEQKNEKLSLIAILPLGIHGIASTGEPSPLIARWKSGGSCDCGGWDEGCMLRILSDVNEDTISSLDGTCAADGAHPIELFTQGEAKENKHAFSMITFKDGAYAVEFRASIASLQVFAMCIAVLHCRKPIAVSGLHRSVKAQSSEEKTIAGHAGVSSASYVYHHPPLSPFGRA